MNTSYKNANVNLIDTSDTNITVDKDARATIEENRKKYDFIGLEDSKLSNLKKVIFQLSLKTIEKACLDVITNGFSYEQVQDPNYEIKDAKNTKYDISRERLGDLRDVMHTLPIQTLKYIDSFVSLTDIVTRCFIETDSEYINTNNQDFIYLNNMTGKRMVYYGFVFADYDTQKDSQYKDVAIGLNINNLQNQEGKKIYVKIPSERKELLGIQPLMRKENTTSNKIEYTALLKNKTVVFDEKLVITTEYGAYDELFKSLFRLQANLLEKMSQQIETSKFLHVKAPKEYFNLKPSEKDIYTEAFKKLVNGENGGIITTDAYQITLQATSQSGSLEKTGLELLSNSIGFVTGVPQSVLFGSQQKGWSTENEEDKVKYEFYLKMLAENFFLPIMQQFCKVCVLEDWDKLEYQTTALIREKLNTWSTLVPDQLKTPERLYYIGLEIDKLLGIDSEEKAKIKKQLEVEDNDDKDSKEDIKKKSNNTKTSSKSSQKNSK